MTTELSRLRSTDGAVDVAKIQNSSNIQVIYKTKTMWSVTLTYNLPPILAKLHREKIGQRLDCLLYLMILIRLFTLSLTRVFHIASHKCK